MKRKALRFTLRAFQTVDKGKDRGKGTRLIYVPGGRFPEGVA